MSVRKGITTWVVIVGKFSVAYRRNMRWREACQTFHVVRGTHVAVACGPLLAEW